MPLYFYDCKKCSNNFEKLIRNTNTLVACPKCQSTKVIKLMPNSHSSLSEVEKRAQLKKVGKAQGVGRSIDRRWDPKKYQEHY